MSITKTTKTCAFCPNTFTPSNARQKCCSPKCTTDLYQRDNRHLPKVKKNCKVCNQEFFTSYSRKNCCSEDCSAKQKKKPLITKECEYCHTLFQSAKQSARFCKKEHCTQWYSENRDRTSEKQTYNRDCPTCKASFTTDQALKLYCQTSCRPPSKARSEVKTIKCLNCPTLITTNNPRRKFCKDECFKAYQRKPAEPVYFICEYSLCRERLLGKKFVQVKPWQKYCSPKCNDRDYAKRSTPSTAYYTRPEHKKEDYATILTEFCVEMEKLGGVAGDMPYFDSEWWSIGDAYIKACDVIKRPILMRTKPATEYCSSCGDETNNLTKQSCGHSEYLCDCCLQEYANDVCCRCVEGNNVIPFISSEQIIERKKTFHKPANKNYVKAYFKEPALKNSQDKDAVIKIYNAINAVGGLSDTQGLFVNSSLIGLAEVYKKVCDILSWKPVMYVDMQEMLG